MFANAFVDSEVNPPHKFIICGVKNFTSAYGEVLPVM